MRRAHSPAQRDRGHAVNEKSSHPLGSHRVLPIFLMAVIGLSIVGLISGIRQSMPDTAEPDVLHRYHAPQPPTVPAGAIPAATYAEMRRRETGPTSRWHYELPRIKTVFQYERCVTCHDPHTLVIEPDQRAKLESLKLRATRRAYNGAPPVVPHAVEKTDDAACATCHEHGIHVGDLVANPMPHRLLPHCLQCHAPPPPAPFASASTDDSKNLFAGLPTPTSGPRAYPDAPPLIPHSTSMRENCLSCHGGIGWPGLEVTHRWRTQCLQCHGVSAALEQGVAGTRSTAYETSQP